jgi:hypothetical protein
MDTEEHDRKLRGSSAPPSTTAADFGKLNFLADGALKDFLYQEHIERVALMSKFGLIEEVQA